MNKIKSAVIAACALAATFVTGSAWALTEAKVIIPSDLKNAIWSEEGVANIGGWTVSLNGNTLNDDGTISISQDATAGVTVHFPAAVSQYTVLMKYSDYTKAASNYTALMDFKNSKCNYVGMLDDGRARAFYVGMVYTSFDNIIGAGSEKTPVPPAAGMMGISYKTGGSGLGSFLFSADGSFQNSARRSGITWSGSTISDITLGGLIAGQSHNQINKPASLKISGIAIFTDYAITADDADALAAYKFPTYVYSQGTASGWGGKCSFGNDLNGITLPATDEAPDGTKVGVAKIEIAQSPDGGTADNRPTRIAITVGETTTTSADFISGGTISASGGNNPVKLTYNFPEGCVLTVGTPATIKWLKADGSEIGTIRYAASNDATGRFLSVNNGSGYSPIALLYGREPVELIEKTIDSDKTWSELWDGPEPGADVKVMLTVVGNPTLTIDEDVVCKKVVLLGSGDLTVSADSVTSESIGKFATSEEYTGSLVFDLDATDGFEASEALLSAIKNALTNVKFRFQGAGEYGIALNFGANVKTLHTHIVFDGGKHSMTWQGNGLFAAEATDENPTLLVDGETTLDFSSKDISGTSGGADIGGVIRVKDGGELNFLQIGADTMFYRQRLWLDPGALVTFTCDNPDGGESGFRWHGGAEQGKEQIYVPASEEDATDNPAIIRQLGAGGFHLASNNTRGCAMFVGKNSKLVFDCDFTEAANNSAYLKKYGEGEFEMAAERTITADFNAQEGIVSLVNEPIFRNFTASDKVTYRFAETVGENEGVALCGAEGSLDAPEKIVNAVVYVGSDELDGMTLTYDDAAKTVAYSSGIGSIDISGPSAGISDINAAYDESYGAELILNIDSPSGEMELSFDEELDPGITKLHVIYKGVIIIKPVEGATIADYNALLAKFDFTQVEGYVIDKRGEYEAAEGADVRTSALNTYMRGYEPLFGVQVILHGGNIVWDAELKCGSMHVISQGNDKVVVSADGYPATAETALATDVLQVVGEVEWQIPTKDIDSKVGGNTYTRGAGTEAEPATFTINVENGVITLKGGDYYFNSGYNGVQTTVNVIGAKVHDGAEAGLGIGQADYVFSGAAEWTAAKLILSQGKEGRTASLTLNDTSKMIVTGSTIDDQNTSSIMFGHWNGPSTFTLNDEAEFLAANAQVLVGKTHNNQTININGGVFTAKGIKASASATGVNMLNIAGGELKLGEFGITSYASTTIAVNVTGNATLTPTAETLPITQPISGEGTLTEGNSTGVIDLTAQLLPLSVKLGGGTFKVNASKDSDLWFKIANLPGDEIPEGLTILDIEGNDITEQLCAYKGGLYFGEIDAYRTRNSEATSADWMVEDGWLDSFGQPTTWVNPEEGGHAYATIDADVTPVITVYDAVVASSVMISNTAPAEGEDEKSFTFGGEGRLTAMIDATKFHGEIVLDADVRGSLTLGDEAYVVIDVPAGDTKTCTKTDEGLMIDDFAINGGEIRVTGAGTLVCDGFVPDFLGLQAETWTGTLYLKNALWTDWSFGSKGHIGSKIKVTSISGYAPNSTGDGANPELILEDGNDTKALLVTNGYGGKNYFFNKVSGSGTFGWDPAATTGPQNGHTYIFKDITDFDGVFDAGAYLKIIVGDTTTTAGRGSITYKDGITVKPNLGWTAQSVLFGNTLDLAEGAKAGDVVVTVANAPAALPVLTIGGEATEQILVYEEGAVKIAVPAKTAGTMLFLR